MHKYFWRILILKRPSLFLEDEMLRFSLLLSIFEIPENLSLYNDDEDDWCWFTPMNIHLTVIFKTESWCFDLPKPQTPLDWWGNLENVKKRERKQKFHPYWDYWHNNILQYTLPGIAEQTVRQSVCQSIWVNLNVMHYGLVNEIFLLIYWYQRFFTMNIVYFYIKYVYALYVVRWGLCSKPVFRPTK